MDSERFIYPGVVALLLALSGFLLWSHKSAGGSLPGEKWFFSLAGVLFLLTYLLAFGPHGDDYLRIPLYGWFYRQVPLFNFPRASTRTLYLSFALLAILAGYGTAAWQRRLGRITFYPVACLMLFFLIIDYLPARSTGISRVPKYSVLYHQVQKELRGGGSWPYPSGRGRVPGLPSTSIMPP